MWTDLHEVVGDLSSAVRLRWSPGHVSCVPCHIGCYRAAWFPWLFPWILGREGYRGRTPRSYAGLVLSSYAELIFIALGEVIDQRREVGQELLVDLDPSVGWGRAAFEVVPNDGWAAIVGWWLPGNVTALSQNVADNRSVRGTGDGWKMTNIWFDNLDEIFACNDFLYK